MVARIDSMREGYRMIAGDPTLIDAIRIRLSARTPSAPRPDVRALHLGQTQLTTP